VFFKQVENPVQGKTSQQIVEKDEELESKTSINIDSDF
jgi:hypothetical protein